MEYTVQQLARLAGVSTRTLRYYDEIGLLAPARINSSGYRIYGLNEVDMLQQILFYRELGLALEDIKAIITAPSFDAAQALREHRQKLLEKRVQLDALIENVNNTIEQKEGRTTMSDKEKFKGFKHKMIEENEKKYGKEAREKYGEEAVNRSNAKLMNMSEEEYNKVVELERQLNETLAQAFAAGDPAGELAQKAAELHKQWLTFYWDQYSKEAHAGLAEMYVADERFTAYYDKEQPGTAKFLRDAILIYTGMGQRE
ncbi:MerR family transcriptional regulator [Bacillus sp. FJAT-27251]|uniref:MerR family transcriptional regulator n=1 Tax=Bacillus sp. FJAT-27251 TaxID=1684142 RepID=UPI0006A764EA|nr:MerR family transcriptional regulator [Bacillus sp. FJAT-27251]